MTAGQGATVGLGAAGYAIGGPFGGAVGWMVGSWLFSEDLDEGNEIIDPGAQELPGFNQALRGVTLPVLFGTNRTESFHSWRKNFEAIRSESKSETGAGGKGGGSGGGGKGASAGGGGAISYTYKLDVMYHLGMTTVPFYLYGGWVGTQRLNDQTVLAIGQGFGSNALLFGANQNVPKEASLEFDESYYYPGDDVNPGWTYFHEQENIPVSSTDTGSLGMRWKNTAWVGFKGLDLGGSPQTPTLQFEVGPGGGDLDLEDGFLGHEVHGTTLAPGALGPGSANGKYYSASRGASGDIMFAPVDGTDITRWTTDIGAFVTAAVQAAGTDHGHVFTTGDSILMVPGTNYILCHAYQIGSGTRLNHGWCLIDVSLVTDGENPWNQANVIGTVYRRSAGLNMQSADEMFAFQMGLKEDSNFLCFAYVNFVGGDNDTRLQGIASIVDFKNNFDDLDTGDSMSALHFNMETLYSDGFPVVEGTGDAHASDHTAWGFTLPYVIGMMGVGTYMYWYIPKSCAKQATNTTIATHAATNPNGFFLRVDFGSAPDPGSGIPVDDGVQNDWLLDGTGGIEVFPFEDEGIGQDGAVTGSAEYRPEVFVHKWQGSEAAGGYLLLFNKVYYGSTEGAPFGINNGVRAFMYNPIAATAIEVAKGTAANPTFDMVADVGNVEGDRYNWFYRKGFLSYSEDTGILTSWGAFDSNSGTPPTKDCYIVSKLGNLTIGGATDVIPPFIIRQILTNPIYGMGYSDSDIDEASYALAVQYCESEKIKVSTKYRREGNFLGFIDSLLSLYGGYMIRRGNAFIFGLMDFGSTSGAAPLRTLDGDHFITKNGEAPIKVVEGAVQDVYNRVKVNFFDRSLEYRQNFVEENDEVDQDFRGIRTKEFAAQYVMSEELARKIAIRGLWSNLYARDKYNFNIGWKDSDLEPGDLVTLVDSIDPKLAGGVRARLTMITEQEPGKWKAAATQELESVVTATPLVNSGTAASSGGFLRGPTGAAHLFSAYELPKEFQGANAQLYVGWAQSEKTMGAKLWLSGDNVTFSQASDVTPHTLSGIFKDGLPLRPVGWIENNVEVYLFPDTRSADFNPSSPAYVEKFTFEDGSETQRALGGTALWVGSEMVAYQGPTIIGSNHYRFNRLYRGWGGTPIQDHSSGNFWWRHGGGVFVQGLNEDKVGTKLYYKVTPYNFSGFVWPVESVDAQEYTIQGTYWRPQNPGTAHIITASLDHTQTTRVGIADITSVHFSADWEDSTRCEGYGALGYGFSTYGHFATDVLSHNWRVEVVGSGDTVVHSTVVGTTTFTYSAGQNLADNGAFRPNVAFKITPRSTFGDALVTEVVSLEFFGV